MKKLFLLFLLFPIIAFSQCISGDCVNGIGKFKIIDYDTLNKSESVSIYVGSFKNEMFHGKGILTNKDKNGKTISEGIWNKNIIEKNTVKFTEVKYRNPNDSAITIIEGDIISFTDTALYFDGSISLAEYAPVGTTKYTKDGKIILKDDYFSATVQ
tara:strand:+ start:1576 stop:2043 length:468 start_codon:yes stop_codon:yes gene_type:complete